MSTCCESPRDKPRGFRKTNLVRQRQRPSGNPREIPRKKPVPANSASCARARTLFAQPHPPRRQALFPALPEIAAPSLFPMDPRDLHLQATHLPPSTEG